MLNLDGGLYQLNFDWAARENQPLDTSKFTVRLNGEDIASILPKDYEINRFSQVVRTLPQGNDLKLIATGKSDSYGATVANFAIFKASQFDGVPGFVNNPQDLPITYIQGNIFNSIQNFVSNGDFELSRINSGQLAVQTSNIPAWLIQNGELGLGSHYNINWNPTTQLVHLDSGKNLNYLTRVNLRRGRYQLSFDWAARDGKRFDTSQVIVRYNGKVLNTLVPVDYFCHRHIAIVDGIDGINTIELIGGGSADRFGASIDNVIIRNYA